jgi:hypothetical protein
MSEMKSVFENLPARLALFSLLAGLLLAGALRLLAPHTDLADLANVIGLGGLLGAVFAEALVRWWRARP